MPFFHAVLELPPFFPSQVQLQPVYVSGGLPSAILPPVSPAPLWVYCQSQYPAQKPWASHCRHIWYKLLCLTLRALHHLDETTLSVPKCSAFWTKWTPIFPNFTESSASIVGFIFPPAEMLSPTIESTLLMNPVHAPLWQRRRSKILPPLRAQSPSITPLAELTSHSSSQAICVIPPSLQGWGKRLHLNYLCITWSP